MTEGKLEKIINKIINDPKNPALKRIPLYKKLEWVIEVLFMKGECDTKRANTIRKEKECLDKWGYFSWQQEEIKRKRVITENIEKGKKIPHCKYEEPMGETDKNVAQEFKMICTHKKIKKIPFNMPCNQQNCPWKKRQENNKWWANHPGRLEKYKEETFLT
jgi:hypothetical protein